MYWIGVAMVIGVMSIVVWSIASPTLSMSFSSNGKPKRMPPPHDVDWKA
ncbi:MAG: hypothetical protein FAZ92_03389 [Accumulibacter sp.]|nr:MAG: hypothetical protein FAZ92_03389 [Accumulibacter sp.]